MRHLSDWTICRWNTRSSLAPVRRPPLNAIRNSRKMEGLYDTRDEEPKPLRFLVFQIPVQLPLLVKCSRRAVWDFVNLGCHVWTFMHARIAPRRHTIAAGKRNFWGRDKA